MKLYTSLEREKKNIAFKVSKHKNTGKIEDRNLEHEKTDIHTHRHKHDFKKERKN